MSQNVARQNMMSPKVSEILPHFDVRTNRTVTKYLQQNKRERESVHAATYTRVVQFFLTRLSTPNTPFQGLGLDVSIILPNLDKNYIKYTLWHKWMSSKTPFF